MKTKAGTIQFSLFLLSFCVYICLSAPLLSAQNCKPAISAANPENIASFVSFIINHSSVSYTTTAPSSSLSVSDTTLKNDRDGDGIVDSLDKCPDEKGVIEYDGCPVPDSDNDGIADDSDACPTVAGLAKYKGCPAPDTDGDKINDEDDKCPTIPGVARYNGCPVGDRDGDGINDDDDKCIDVRGTVKNFGCPENKIPVKQPYKEKKKKF